MSKIDKIIQIVSPHGGGIFGISESGRMYTFEPKSEASDGKVWPANWSLEIESPVVDNSACEVNELNKYDIPSVSSSAITKEHFGNFLKRPK